MATSGSLTKNVTSDGRIQLVFGWKSGTPNVASNYTPVTWHLDLQSLGGGANIVSSVSKDCSVTINGTTVYSGKTMVNIHSAKTRTLTSGTVNIPHNVDGTKTFIYSFSQAFNITYSGASVGTITGSSSGTLDTINRASTLGTIADFTIESGVAIPITKLNSGYSDTLNIYIGDTWIKRVQGLTNNQKVTFTSAELSTIYSAMSNVTSASFKFVNTTYSGANAIGTSEKYAKGSISASIKPTISSVALSEAVSGLNAQFGAYVQNQSKLSGTITATAGAGSTIASYKTEIGNYVYSNSTFTTNTLLQSGSVPIKVTVTDARGRTATYETTVTVVAYDVPQMPTFKAVRCNSEGTEDVYGTYVKINFSASISPVGNKNTKNFKVQYKKRSDADWTDLTTYTAGYTYSLTDHVVSGFSTDYPYDFRVVATDYFITSNFVTAVPSGFSLLDFKADGKGMAIGKVSTKNALEIGMTMYDKFDALIGNGLSIYKGDPDTTLEALLLTETNTPAGTGFCYIQTFFYSTKSETSNRTQIAYPYAYSTGSLSSRCYIRIYITGTGWSAWQPLNQSLSTVDYGGSLRSGNIMTEYGIVTITPVANTPTTVKLTFKHTYKKVPLVLVVAGTGAIGTQVMGASVNGVSTTTANLVMTRTNTIATNVQYCVIGEV